MILVPESEWNLDFATPQLYCTTKDSKCVQLDYMFPKDAVMVKVEPVEGEPIAFSSKSVKGKYLKAGVNTIKLNKGMYNLSVDSRYFAMLVDYPDFTDFNRIYTVF